MPQGVPAELRELGGLDLWDVLAVVLQEAAPALLVALEAVQDGKPGLRQQLVHLLDVGGWLVVRRIPEEGGSCSPAPSDPGASLSRGRRAPRANLQLPGLQAP
eukprot:10721203-Alexandrium_andersonii.AAC.1